MPDFNLSVMQNNTEINVPAKAGESILSALRGAGISGLRAACGGNGTCGQCSVSVTGNISPLTKGEPRAALGEKLLACRWRVAGDARIIIPDDTEMTVVTKGASKIPPTGRGLGVSVDIGTTTLALFLYELSTGAPLAVESGRNAQRPYGADVLSRIQYSAGEGGLRRLAEIIREQISRAMDAACKRAGRSRNEIVKVSIAGNTVMEHIFVELSPVTIGVAPFNPLSLFGETEAAVKYFSGLDPNAELYLAPAIAGYVGGDITAGLYSSGAYKQEQTCLFLDIGTNGEMGIGDKSGFICCATAAGPAFEGAEIDCGMDGSSGAIGAVRYINGEIDLDVIGDTVAVGICGSGLIDALAAMIKCGAVLESGRMASPEDAPANVRDRLKRDENGKMRFYLTKEVYVSAEDVRRLQLAKSAIRAGIETLLALSGKSAGEVSSVYIAGGFGAFVDVASACAIGLLPPALKDKTRHVGNTAGWGAALALEGECRQELGRLAKLCQYHELSTSRIFMEKYIEHMAFDESGILT